MRKNRKNWECVWELKRCFPCVCYTQLIPRLWNSQPIPCACYGILETRNKHINTHVVLNYNTIMVPLHFASRNVNTFEPNINQLFVNYQKKGKKYLLLLFQLRFFLFSSAALFIYFPVEDFSRQQTNHKDDWMSHNANSNCSRAWVLLKKFDLKSHSELTGDGHWENLFIFLISSSQSRPFVQVRHFVSWRFHILILDLKRLLPQMSTIDLDSVFRSNPQLYKITFLFCRCCNE